MATSAETEKPNPSAGITRAGWYALTLVSAAQAMSLLDRQILSILATDIRRDLGIGDAELGLLYGTVFALFYALFSLPLGRLVDGWIRTRLLGICLCAWSFCAGLAAFANGFLLLAISRLGVGIGEGATQPAANSIIFDSFPRNRRGIGMAGLGIGLALGLGLSMTLGGIVAEWWDGLYPDGDAPLGFAGWQFAFIVASLPGFPLAYLIYTMKEPERGAMDGIKAPEDPHPFKASANVLGAVTPGSNWFYLWHRNAGAKQWAINFIGLAVILALCTGMTLMTQSFSPRPSLDVMGLPVDPHILQWSVVGFGMFVILNLFQSFKLTDKPTYNVVLSPSLILLMVVGGLQTSINYGVMGFTPSFLIRDFGLSPAQAGVQFGLLAAGLGMVGPIVAGPLSDWLTSRMGMRGMVLLVLVSLGISPFFGIWAFSADDPGSFYLRFVAYSLILTLWLPPAYALMLGLVLPRMRGITFSTYTIVMTLLGLGIGPYFVGIVSDRNGGDLGQAIMSVNLLAPLAVICLLIVLMRVKRDESTMLDRARKGGEVL
ncbi:MFS family permease [Altererythrobacter atlanticus]|uniref:L-galactonate transporter n=1 Tax=Croceibacterium atlanticum TaxID=1267766 RepID=A0A0F7KVS6_9SPHN|nr:MFS transporter [Croceibacterium atlanticum]AKH43819.1 L-galactonate transporter [Croceibacterium atlanticum]MBB5733731.1 MFS family permease [Croceibacterium atlanticum]